MVLLYNLDAGQYQNWAILSKKPIKSAHLKRSHEVTVVKSSHVLDYKFFYSISHFYNKIIRHILLNAIKLIHDSIFTCCWSVLEWYFPNWIPMIDRIGDNCWRTKLDFQNISGLRRVYFILETIQVQLEAISTSLVQ